MIGRHAFSACSKMTAIIIPASVSCIGAKAFADCAALAEVTFENTIGWSADETAIADTELADPAKAAEYLTATYKENTWTRTEE